MLARSLFSVDARHWQIKVALTRVSLEDFYMCALVSLINQAAAAALTRRPRSCLSTPASLSPLLL